MNLNTVIESKILLYKLNKVYELYFKHGSRSDKKVNYFHNFIKNIINKHINNNPNYKVYLEQNIPSINSSNKKRCDIVVYKNKEPYIIFPTKIIMTNYKQNKNNSWENLTGELMHLKWANKNINIIPINIFIDKTPYLDKNNIIKKIELISKIDIDHYDILIKNNIAYDILNYIIEVKHFNQINEIYNTTPMFIKYKYQYKSLNNLLKTLII